MSILLCLVLRCIPFSHQFHAGTLASKTIFSLRFLEYTSTLAQESNHNAADRYEEQYRLLAYKDDDPTATSSKGEVLANKFQEYKGKAESKAWEFYASPPSEWTSSQWDMFFIVTASLSVICCCTAGCFAYCFVVPVYDEEDGNLMKTSRRRRLRMLRRRRRLMMERRYFNTDEQSSSQGTVDANSHSTVEVEDEKEKAFLKQVSLVRNISMVKSFEQVMTSKKTTSQGSNDSETRSVKSEPAQYTRMMV